MQRTLLILMMSSVSARALAQRFEDRGYTPADVACRECRWVLGPAKPVTALVPDSALWFGRIAGATVDGRGRLYVADPVAGQVVRIDPAARRALRIGRRGQGPGEFQVPQLMTIAPDDRLFVYDPALARVSVFDTGGVFESSFQLPIILAGAAAMVTDGAGRLFISGAAVSDSAADFVIHAVTTGGAYLFSFARASTLFPDPASRLALDGGPLWWDPTSRMLWFSRRGPEFELAAYDDEGVLRLRIRMWDGRLASWQSPLRTARQRDQVRASATPTTGTVALAPLPGGYLLNVSIVDDARTARYTVFRAPDGTLLADWQDPANHIIALGDGRGFVYGFEPVGEIEVVRFPVALPLPTRLHKERQP